MSMDDGEGKVGLDRLSEGESYHGKNEATSHDALAPTPLSTSLL